MDRATAVNTIIDAARPRDFLVAALGYISRDVNAFGRQMADRCFCCMGSMGSVTPLAVGISLARPAERILALEGDGSLLMNLGSLVTLRRYGSPQCRLLVFDNGCYESTGGQPSQPAGFALEQMCAAAGLKTEATDSASGIAHFLADGLGQVLVIKVARGGSSPRIDSMPAEIANRFARELQMGG